MTPSIPEQIRGFQLDGYENVFSLISDETRLFGTESMYGDWSGHTLLLAKDFYPSSFVRDRIAAGHPRPYSHNPDAPTNQHLHRLVEPLTRSADPDRCGFLYGSALACLLRADGRKSGTLPAEDQALDFGADALRFVIENMPALKTIVCMGEQAWDCAGRVFGLRRAFRDQRDSGTAVVAGPLALIAAFHPGARVSTERKLRAWEPVLGRQRAA